MFDVYLVRLLAPEPWGERDLTVVAEGIVDAIANAKHMFRTATRLDAVALWSIPLRDWRGPRD